MIKYLRFETFNRILKEHDITEQIFKPLGIYRNVHYSNDIKIKPIKNEGLVDSDKMNHKFNPKEKILKLFNPGYPVLGLIALASLGSCLCIFLGTPDVDADGKVIRDDLSNESTVIQYIKRAYREGKYYLKLLEQPQNEKLLPDPLKSPYKQPKYTLVIELTDVLVHPEWTYSSGWRYKKRPLVEYFLEILKDSYEIVLYTAESGRAVFPLIDAIDPNNIIAFKLVGGTNHFTGFRHVKQLHHLNRDLSKVICIDWDARNVRRHPENLLNIKRWIGKDDDTSLLDLAAFLKTIADNQIEDVREVLIYYSKYDDPVETFRIKQEKLIEELEEEAAKKEPQKINSRFNLFN